MANPLFIDDLHDLQRELRLSGIEHCDDVQAILERCVLRFRVEFIKRVGFAETTALQAVTFTAEPSTTDEWRRAAARLLEVKSVWCHLVCELPVHFADASGDDFQALNEEGTWRQLDADDREQLLSKCNEEIGELYDIIVQADIEDDCDVQVFDGTPTCGTSAYPPAGSAFCNARPFRGNFIVPTIALDGQGSFFLSKDCSIC